MVRTISENFQKGITIITPAYKCEDYILNLLNSLNKQSIDFNLFEILIVINGERDNTENIFKNFKNKNPHLNIKIFESEKGASNARNVAIENIEREYTIFIDADDYISSNYLEKLYSYASTNRIVFGSFWDVEFETNEIIKTYFTDFLLNNQGVTEINKFLPGSLIITTNKLVPSYYIKQVKFNPNLRNSVDVAYFSRFYSKFDLELFILPKEEEAIYYRLRVPNSLSRSPISYQHNITDKIKVMKEVDNDIKHIENIKAKKALIKLINVGQMTFINRYLDKYPEDYNKVLKDIQNADIENFKRIPLTDKLKEYNPTLVTIENLKQDIKILRKENNYYKRLLKTKPYKIAGLLRKISLKIRKIF